MEKDTRQWRRLPSAENSELQWLRPFAGSIGHAEIRLAWIGAGGDRVTGV
jgi:hypothetical protein